MPQATYTSAQPDYKYEHLDMITNCSLFRIPIHVMHSFFATLDQNESFPILVRGLLELGVRITRRPRYRHSPGGIDIVV
jgi:hypothetical protein